MTPAWIYMPPTGSAHDGKAIAAATDHGQATALAKGLAAGW
eukprot:CAMPEP_0197895034 /NCGR_PEP_ID=MMETSP1439-20131203/36296_1 /TAXON_ID=66791 /ORGANISM="Gonyaulax spinifera, Strain CCMP409" /LENGTH=40 /DNA_ID= /DNA_START= /DNA_END= /DNA_ORIENTATION=